MFPSETYQYVLECLPIDCIDIFESLESSFTKERVGVFYLHLLRLFRLHLGVAEIFEQLKLLALAIKGPCTGVDWANS